MSKSILTTATILCLAIANPVWAETPDFDSSQHDDQAICKRYAQADQITPDQMAEYMSQCLKDLAEQGEGDFGTAASEEESPDTNVEESPDTDVEESPDTDVEESRY